MTARRVTLHDIAERAGVTRAAVSFALNDAPGVSDATRARVQAIAAELGYQPNLAARALRHARSETVGMVIDRPPGMIGAEPFFMQLIAGMQSVLSERHISLLFTLTEDAAQELAVYRSWWAQSRVDGVLVVDVKQNDRRVEVLQELGTPAVYVGVAGKRAGDAAVAFDDAACTREIIEYLAGLGHRRIARVSGMTNLVHTRIRDAAARRAARQHDVELVIVRADYTAEGGAAATSELLAQSAPTAIVYDNDLMALAGLNTLTRAGVKVPRDMSIMAWDDSVMCELAQPSITALHRDIQGYGAFAARRLLELLDGVKANDAAPQELSSRLVVRASTSAPRRTAH